jgi:ethanolamine-phosphate cytidylyltransferase
MTFQVPTSDVELPPGDSAPEVLEDRIWVDGCWDFFHHGFTALPPELRSHANDV